jgi:hypothetical protein
MSRYAFERSFQGHMKAMGLKKKTTMSFKHLKMLNFASKCLKITFKVIKFSKLMGDIPHVKFMPRG